MHAKDMQGLAIRQPQGRKQDIPGFAADLVLGGEKHRVSRCCLGERQSC